MDAVSAEDQASQPLFDLRALSLCACPRSALPPCSHAFLLRLPVRAVPVRLSRTHSKRLLLLHTTFCSPQLQQDACALQVCHSYDGDAHAHLRGGRGTGRHHAHSAGAPRPALSRPPPRPPHGGCPQACRAPCESGAPLHLQVGAVAGLLVCHLVRAAADAAGYGGPPASLPVYGVVGAGATLSGALRYKATAVLITVEATGAWSLVVPVVISGARLPCRSAHRWMR